MFRRKANGTSIVEDENLHTVEVYLLARHGMSEVVRQIYERLAAKGHEVTVATNDITQRTTETFNGERVSGFNVQAKSAVGIWGDVEGYQRFLLDNNPYIIVNFAAQYIGFRKDVTLLISTSGGLRT